MTCTIQELTSYWKQYTLSEPVWNEVREEIYHNGKAAGAEELNITFNEVLEECVQDEGIKTACRIMMDRAIWRIKHGENDRSNA